ncbi:hypothetical protein NQZ68_004970 [Scomber scombrus]|uniref:Uncharacterized protein n=1 Tax=Scomber scombrus TaxID=13677 RepID=A0AAV1NUC4_SCOSC
MSGSPPLWFTLTPAIQTSRSPQSSLGCRILCLQLCFRRSLSSQFFWSNTSQAAAASDQPLQRPVGRMPQTPVYHAKVGNINYRCMAENVGDTEPVTPATSRPVDCVAADSTVTK